MKSRVIQDEPEGNDPPYGEPAPADRTPLAGRSRVLPGVLLMAAVLIVVVLIVWV
jgi:hypothetical protein